MAWQPRPLVTKLNRGLLCFFCNRCYEGNYQSQPKYKDLKVFQRFLGNDKTLYINFFVMRNELVNFFVSQGMTKMFTGRKGRINWEAMGMRVASFHTKMVEVRAAPNRIIPLEDYQKTEGCPWNNGKNHQVIWHEGIQCVRMPGKREWLETAVEQRGVTKETEHVNEDTAITGSEIENTFTGLSAQLLQAFARPPGEVAPDVNMYNISGSSGLGGPQRPPGGGSGIELKEDSGVSSGLFGGVMAVQPPATSCATPRQPPGSGSGTPGAPKKPGKRRAPSSGSSDGAEAADWGKNPKRGRPAADRRSELQECIKEYQESGSDEKFFAQPNAHRRRMERIHGEFVSLICTQEEIDAEWKKNDEAGVERKMFYLDTDDIIALKKAGQEQRHYNPLYSPRPD